MKTIKKRVFIALSSIFIGSALYPAAHSSTGGVAGPAVFGAGQADQSAIDSLKALIVDPTRGLPTKISAFKKFEQEVVQGRFTSLDPAVLNKVRKEIRDEIQRLQQNAMTVAEVTRTAIQADKETEQAKRLDHYVKNITQLANLESRALPEISYIQKLIEQFQGDIKAHLLPDDPTTTSLLKTLEELVKRASERDTVVPRKKRALEPGAGSSRAGEGDEEESNKRARTVISAQPPTATSGASTSLSAASLAVAVGLIAGAADYDKKEKAAEEYESQSAPETQEMWNVLRQLAQAPDAAQAEKLQNLLTKIISTGRANLNAREDKTDIVSSVTEEPGLTSLGFILETIYDDDTPDFLHPILKALFLLFLERGADRLQHYSSNDSFEQLPFNRVIDEADLELADALLAKNKEEQLSNPGLWDGNTTMSPIALSYRRMWFDGGDSEDYTPVFNYLLEKGADPDDTDYYPMLARAVYQEDEHIVRALLEAGASTEGIMDYVKELLEDNYGKGEEADKEYKKLEQIFQQSLKEYKEYVAKRTTAIQAAIPKLPPGVAGLIHSFNEASAGSAMSTSSDEGSSSDDESEGDQ